MRVAICDDCKEDRKAVRDCLKRINIGSTTLEIEEFYDGSDLVEAYHKGRRFNLLLLDIQMRKMDGLNTADMIRDLDRDVTIAFITSKAEYLSKALFVEASAFLVKPIKEKDVCDILLHAVKRQRANEEYSIILQLKKEIRYLNPSEIMHISTDTNRTLKYSLFTGEEIIVYKKMKDAADELSGHDFIYLSRSCIANPRYINGFKQKDKAIRMVNGEELPVNSKEMERIYSEYCKYVSKKTNKRIELYDNFKSDL